MWGTGKVHIIRGERSPNQCLTNQQDSPIEYAHSPLAIRKRSPHTPSAHAIWCLLPPVCSIAACHSHTILGQESPACSHSRNDKTRHPDTNRRATTNRDAISHRPFSNILYSWLQISKPYPVNYISNKITKNRPFSHKNLKTPLLRPVVWNFW